MNVWKKNRVKSGIPVVEICNRLNIPEEKYLEIEEGLRSMPKSIINKFLDLVNNKNEIKGELSIKMFEMNEWYKNTDLKQKRLEFGYKTQGELANELGVHNSHISRFESDPMRISEKFRLKAYNFFQDELNKKVKPNIKSVTKTYKRNTPELNVADIEKQLGLTSVQMIKILRVHPSTYYAWKQGRNGISEKYKNKLIQMLNNKQEKIVDDIVETTPIEEVNKDWVIEDLHRKIQKLEKTIKCYEKLIERL
jgi:predicted transcriptional regulator